MHISLIWTLPKRFFDSYRILYDFVERMYERTFKAIEAMEQKMKDKE